MKKQKHLLLSIGFLLFFGLFSNAQVGVYKAGKDAGYYNSTGDYNTYVGDSAGYQYTSGSYNTLMGYRAGYFLNYESTSSSDNTIIGSNAMGGSPTTATSSHDNVIVGARAGFNHYGTDVVIIGTQAGEYNTNGADVVFVGEEAGRYNTTGDDNVFIGEDAGYYNTTASDNTFVGNQAGKQNTTGYRNAFFGNEAGWDNTTGYWNTCIGDSAGVDNSTGNANTFVGHGAGACTEYGSNNTFVGNYAGWDNNRTNNSGEGLYNTYLGSRTGYTNREGNGNTLIGFKADFANTASTGNNNQDNVAIGRESMVGSQSNGTNGIVALGAYSRVNKHYSISIGYSSYSQGSRSVSLGYDIDVSNGDNDVAAVGYDATVAGSRITLLGTETNGADNDATAIGYQATADSMSIAIGSTSSATGNYSVAIGSGATTAQNNSMVLGGLTAADRVSIGIGTAMPNLNSSIDLSENNKGFLINRLSGTEKTTFASSLASADEGMMVYDSTANLLNVWDGSQWVSSGIQSLDLTSNTLTLSNSNSVDLSSYLDNTDNQDLSLSANTLSLSNDATSVDLSGYLDNTDAQDLTLTTNTLSLTNDATSVDLSGYLDNTDEQDLTGATLTGTSLQIDIENGNSATVDLASLQDGTGTDDQNLALTGNDLSIEDGNSVDLSAYMDNTDAQDLTLTTNTLSLTNDATSVDLSGYLDNTDEQDLTGATLTGTSLQIDIENGNSATVDLASLQDGTGTDDQNLALTGNDLSIEDGNSVDLSAYMDNTDAQTLSLTGDDLTISGGNTITIPAGSDDQTLALTGNDLSIEDGNSVDLSAYMDNTDEQTLSLSGSDLTISGGNTITIPAGSDNQDLTGANLNGTVLQIDIENGSSVSIDLAPMLQDIYTTLAEHEAEITQLQEDVAYLMTFHQQKVAELIGAEADAELYQNIPNPTNGSTRINYYIPQEIENAQIIIYDEKGVVLKTEAIKNRGLDYIDVETYNFEKGTYFYTLIVNDKKVSTKKMIVMN